MTTYLKTPDGRVFTTDHAEYHKECEKLTVAAGKAAYKAQAKNDLLNLIKPGQTVYCTLRSVSASGMSRRISLHIVDGAEIREIDYLVSIALGEKRSDKGGLMVSGCGMDMGFDLVYRLGYALWPNGTPEPHGTRNCAPDSNGGYALKHSWI